MPKYVVAKVSDIDEGGHIVVDIKGRSIGVFRLDGAFYGLLNRCPHRGGPMCEGLVVSHLESAGPGDFHLDAARKLLECPWHGWEFDIKTGKSYFDPIRLRKYSVEVQRGDCLVNALQGQDGDLVEGPYTAETIAVSIEEDYVVVALR